VESAIGHYEREMMTDGDGRLVGNRVLVFVAHGGLIDCMR